METEIALDPIALGALGMDGIMTSAHDVSHFVELFGRHINPRALGHMRSLMRRGAERLRAMILHMAYLP